MSNISSWSTTAANNNATPPNGWPETTMLIPQINDSARENMAATARWYQDQNGSLVTTGTGDDYVLATNNANTALTDVPLLTFRADRTNTGAATLNVDGLGAKAWVKFGGDAMVAGDIRADQLCQVAYNLATDVLELITPASSMFPTGVATIFTGDENVIPAGFIIANGGLHLRAALPNLWGFAQTSGNFAVEASKTHAQYGDGDGSTTFSVPDYQDDFLRGVGALFGVGDVFIDLFKSHAHGPGTLTDTFTPLAGGQTIISARNGSISTPTESGAAFSTYSTSQQVAADPITLSLTGSTGSSGDPSETRPRGSAVHFIIKT